MVVVVVALLGETLERVGRLRLDEEFAGAGDVAVWHEDAASGLGHADLVAHDEDLAPQEGVRLEALSGEGDRALHDPLARQRAVACERGLEPTPESRHPGAAAGGDVGG